MFNVWSLHLKICSVIPHCLHGHAATSISELAWNDLPIWYPFPRPSKAYINLQGVNIVYFCISWTNSVHSFTNDHFDLQHSLTVPVPASTLPANNNGWGGQIFTINMTTHTNMNTRSYSVTCLAIFNFYMFVIWLILFLFCFALHGWTFSGWVKYLWMNEYECL